MEKTELMKRYESETGNEVQSDAFAQHEIWEYIRWLESQLTDQTLEKFQEIIRNQCDEISELKDQLTWRPVSEKPEKEGKYWTKLKMFGGYIAYDVHDFNGEKFVSLGSALITHWLPIPPAPEGEVK